MAMKISIGNDHGGYELAMFLIKYLQKNDIDIIYYGTFSKENSVDYPDYAERVAKDIASGKSNFGILICRSGIGMCIAANKMHYIRAANCWNVKIAQFSRKHNDANVICLGADFIKTRDARAIVDAFFDTKFEGRHGQRIEKIAALEKLW
jgi:ribose 5-phosphate isomerase B